VLVVAVGRKALRGIGRPIETAKSERQRRAPGASGEAQRRATWRGTTRSACTSRLPGARSRRMSAVVAAKGGFATTRNGSRGSRRSLASAVATVTASAPKRSRKRRARSTSSSTATTRAPAAARGAVSAPSPAPTSTTSAPGGMPASATMRVAQRLSSRWYPHHRTGCRPDTADHDRCHAVSLGERCLEIQHRSAGDLAGGSAEIAGADGHNRRAATVVSW